MRHPRLTPLGLIVAAGVSLAPFAAAGAPPPRPVLPFIEDDYTRAMAEAQARKLPLFIDSWAPW